MTDFVLADLKGESVLKRPGSVNGESFVIKNLEDCSVYLLDYTSEVEVSNCVNCSIFIGPVDGPAIFDNCTGCKVAVASQQFQAKGCSGCKFGLYCATQPSLTGCSTIEIGSWVGAYPGLAAHFAAANLDPKANNWNKVYDGSAEDGSEPNFSLVTDAPSWEMPIEGADGPLENPVPTPDGRTYSGAPAPAADEGMGGGEPTDADLATAAAFPEDAFVASPPPASGELPADFFGGGGDAPAENGYTAPQVYEEDNPRVIAMREAQRERLKEQEVLEQEKKAAAKEKASDFLAKFYESRNSRKEAQRKDNRENDVGTPTKHSVEGDTAWEKVINLIDFQFNRPNGADLTRLKGCLYGAKSKNIDVASK